MYFVFHLKNKTDTGKYDIEVFTNASHSTLLQILKTKQNKTETMIVPETQFQVEVAEIFQNYDNKVYSVCLVLICTLETKTNMVPFFPICLCICLI